MTSQARPLRIALLSYKGNPFCGGQGVYVRHLSRELAALGHRVEVIGAQPYPVLDAVGEGVTLTELPSLDLYRQPDPFRTPRLREYRDWIDVLEVATMWTGGFPEPLTFSLRARRHLAARRDEFDVVHDNQTLGYGLLGLDLPLVTTVHHPITVDRRLDLAAAPGWRKRLSYRRWYGFTRMQGRVARRLPSVVTVSGASRDEITEDLGVGADRIRTVPIGADTRIFAPDPAVPEVPGRIVTTSSADVPLKGLVFLVEALAKVRVQRPDAHLVVVGARPAKGAVADAIDDFGLQGAVDFVKGISDGELVDLLRSAQVACVPSLYEGFSLPAAEAMATGTALVATTGGAIPEVAGPDGETCLAVPPADVGALAAALDRVLSDDALRLRLGRAGRERVLTHFTWARAAQATADIYREAIATHRGPAPRSPGRSAAQGSATLGRRDTAAAAGRGGPDGPSAAPSTPGRSAADGSAASGRDEAAGAERRADPDGSSGRSAHGSRGRSAVRGLGTGGPGLGGAATADGNRASAAGTGGVAAGGRGEAEAAAAAGRGGPDGPSAAPSTPGRDGVTAAELRADPDGASGRSAVRDVRPGDRGNEGRRAATDGGAGPVRRRADAAPTAAAAARSAAVGRDGGGPEAAPGVAGGAAAGRNGGGRAAVAAAEGGAAAGRGRGGEAAC